MDNRLLIPNKPNPTTANVIEYVKTAPLDELEPKVFNLNAKSEHDHLHPVEERFIEEFNKKKATGDMGGRRRSSKKHPTARRRRSSKARNSRKVRKSRTTRRK